MSDIKNKKGLKTTIVASAMGLLGIALFVLWFMDIIDNMKFTMGLAGISTLGGTIIGLFSKDASASHTQDFLNTQGTVPPGGTPPPNDPDDDQGN